MCRSSLMLLNAHTSILRNTTENEETCYFFPAVEHLLIIACPWYSSGGLLKTHKRPWMCEMSCEITLKLVCYSFAIPWARVLNNWEHHLSFLLYFCDIFLLSNSLQLFFFSNPPVYSFTFVLISNSFTEYARTQAATLEAVMLTSQLNVWITSFFNTRSGFLLIGWVCWNIHTQNLEGEL